MATVVPSAALALALRNPNPNSTLFFLPKPLSSSPSLHRISSPNSLHLRLSRLSKSLAVSSSLASPPPPPPTLLSESTRTLSSLLALALSVSKFVLSLPARIAAAARAAPSAAELAEIRDLRGSLACTVGPLFFAAVKDRPRGYINTPLTVVAAGMAKWLEIYCGVLMVRVLLSWFPNIPWDRQPLSAIRDLCDPYLNLFRNIIPPVFDTLDVSPLLAFAVLGFLSSVLNSTHATY